MHDLGGLEAGFPVQWDFAVGCAALAQFAVAGRRGSRERVESARGQHFGRRVDEVQRLEGRAVEFLQVQALDVVVGVRVDGVLLSPNQYCCPTSILSVRGKLTFINSL